MTEWCNGPTMHSKEVEKTVDPSVPTGVYNVTTKPEDAWTTCDTCNLANCPANRENVNTNKITDVVVK